MRLAVLFLTCIALLATQLGGWHLHASADGAALDEPVAHSTHIHQIDPDGHDHSKDVDIAVGDFGLVLSKLLPALLAVALVLLSVILDAATRVAAARSYPVTHAPVPLASAVARAAARRLESPSAQAGTLLVPCPVITCCIARNTFV